MDGIDTISGAASIVPNPGESASAMSALGPQTQDVGITPGGTQPTPTGPTPSPSDNPVTQMMDKFPMLKTDYLHTLYSNIQQNAPNLNPNDVPNMVEKQMWENPINIPQDAFKDPSLKPSFVNTVNGLKQQGVQGGPNIIGTALQAMGSIIARQGPTGVNQVWQNAYAQNRAQQDQAMKNQLYAQQQQSYQEDNDPNSQTSQTLRAAMEHYYPKLKNVLANMSAADIKAQFGSIAKAISNKLAEQKINAAEKFNLLKQQDQQNYHDEMILSRNSNLFERKKQHYMVMHPMASEQDAEKASIGEMPSSFQMAYHRQGGAEGTAPAGTEIIQQKMWPNKIQTQTDEPYNQVMSKLGRDGFRNFVDAEGNLTRPGQNLVNSKAYDTDNQQKWTAHAANNEIIMQQAQKIKEIAGRHPEFFGKGVGQHSLKWIESKLYNSGAAQDAALLQQAFARIRTAGLAAQAQQGGASELRSATVDTAVMDAVTNPDMPVGAMFKSLDDTTIQARTNLQNYQNRKYFLQHVGYWQGGDVAPGSSATTSQGGLTTPQTATGGAKANQPIASPGVTAQPPAQAQALAPNEVRRLVNGRVAIFDKNTRQFLRYEQ